MGVLEGMALIEEAWFSLQKTGAATYALAATVIVLAISWLIGIWKHEQEEKLPPHIPSTIPFLGQAISFGQSPIEFLLAAYEKYGPVFRVAYDVPNPVFLEQKKIFKTGLCIARFREHVHMIEEETVNYFKRWGESGEKNLFVAMSELVILTASRCLHGKEIRAMLDERMAQLYMDLDGGFTAQAWLLPGWLPLPSFRKRDKAHLEVKRIFHQVIKKRRESDQSEDDMLQTILDATYKSHTSSTTSTWLLFFLARHKDIQDRVFEEQKRLCKVGSQWQPLDYDVLKDMQLLDRCLKETLRLRPPIMTMMRMCKAPQKVLGYTIPPGHQVCVSPTTNHRLPDTWKDVDQFRPDRFLDPDVANSEKFAYIPFGAGRHRCIGESFAYVQIKTLVATMLRTYEFHLVDGYFPEVDFTTMIHTPKHPVIRYRPRQDS
ncbi:hypothetical protein BaRGS_00009421 [Batillaria attramentaria]|uniref:Lanosterol 14-alpha demethylase n=1 Tax=Batillaria attramentaria TaxID=370345 RepID=A0ABD0LJI3_9CAEN